MSVSVFVVGLVVRNGAADRSGTLKVASTSQAAGASTNVGSSGNFKVALSVSYGDLITFTLDNGTVFTATSRLATPPTAAQCFPIYWDTATGVIAGLGVQP